MYVYVCQITIQFNIVIDIETSPYFYVTIFQVKEIGTLSGCYSLENENVLKIC